MKIDELIIYSFLLLFGYFIYTISVIISHYSVLYKIKKFNKLNNSTPNQIFKNIKVKAGDSWLVNLFPTYCNVFEYSDYFVLVLFKLFPFYIDRDLLIFSKRPFVIQEYFPFSSVHSSEHFHKINTGIYNFSLAYENLNNEREVYKIIFIVNEVDRLGFEKLVNRFSNTK